MIVFRLISKVVIKKTLKESIRCLKKIMQILYGHSVHGRAIVIQIVIALKIGLGRKRVKVPSRPVVKMIPSQCPLIIQLYNHLMHLSLLSIKKFLLVMLHTSSVGCMMT